MIQRFKPDSAEHSRSTFCSRAFESQHDPTTHNEPQDTTAPTAQQSFFKRACVQARSVVQASSSAWDFVGTAFTTEDVSRGKSLSSKRRHPNNQVSRPETPTEGNDVDEDTTSKRNMFSRKTSPQRTASFRETIVQRTCSLRRSPFTEEVDVVERTT
jgi:hypothetical protein